MAISTAALLTADEFWELPDQPGVRLELVDGNITVTPEGGVTHAKRVIAFYSLVRSYAIEHDLGHACPAGPAYLLQRDPDTVRIPDVSLIPHESRSEVDPRDTYLSIVPTLAVEVVSSGKTAVELRRRVRDYVEAGVSQVWVVWPKERTVSVYSGSMVPTEYARDDTLDGGDVLPGFSVRVAELFDIEW